jgi:putative mRNA 3-end processing factor
VLEINKNGLYCAAGDFYVDPWRPVLRAVITHAHSDHTCPGSETYLCASPARQLVSARAGEDARIETLEYGEPLHQGGVRLSLHPAGHILGSCQVRLERAGEVWIVSGDYKLEPDITCTPFEPLAGDVFVTESTFGLPIYRWPPQQQVFDEIDAWWKGNQAAGRTSVLLAYPLGKAQRVLAGIDSSIGPILVHGAVERFNALYRQAGVPLPETHPLASPSPRGALVFAPPWTAAPPWFRRLGPASTGLVSGWMRIRGTRRRRSLDRGFVLSDHADWPDLLRAIEATGAGRILVTHGYRFPLVRWLREGGLDAQAVETQFAAEHDETDAADAAEEGR